MPDSPAQSTNLQGQTLADGRFVIVNLLGSGGMADVYRAYDNETRQDIAVKMPKLNLLANEEFVRRFDREVAIMKGLRHPHIVPVLFAGKHEGHTFAVFPYLTGGSLGDRLKGGNSYSRPPTANADLFWLMQIAMALDYLHGLGLLHRDVKPDNIMFDAEGKAYLNDFGIVRALAPEEGGNAATVLTAANVALGSMPYMAPELIVGTKDYTGAVDQYSLAITLYHILSGRRPFTGESQQIMYHQVHSPLPPLAEARPDLPASACAAVHRALAKQAGARFTSCIELARAVVRSIQGDTNRRPVGVRRRSTPNNSETLQAPRDQPTQRAAIFQQAAGVRRRSTQSASPVSSAHRAPFTPPANAGGSPRRWWIIGTSIAAVLLVTTLLIISSSRPEKSDSHVKKSKVNPLPPVVQPNPQPVTPKLEKYITNSIGMKLVLIPAGKFIMGSPVTEKERFENEGPQHEVHITKPFYMGVYEVTQAQYQQVMGVNPSCFSSGGSGKAQVAGINTSDFPVETVSWNDAVEFCNKLSNLPAERAAGRVYRLPSEAEWEYTCRGGAFSYQVFHFGNSLSSTQANFNGYYPYGGAANGPYLGRTTTVGSYQPNAFGVYDMHGNVWEWCADWYDAEYYGKSPLRDPLCLTEGSNRVVRGGCWCYDGRDCRAAYRLWFTPAYRSGSVGFRTALVPSGQ